VGQGYGNLGEVPGQLAVVSCGVEAQGLDVPQQRDLPLQFPFRSAERDDVREEIREEAVSASVSVLDAGQGLDLPERQGQEFQALVPLDLVGSLLVQQDDLQGDGP